MDPKTLPIAGDRVTISGHVEEIDENGMLRIRFEGLGSKHFAMWFAPAHVALHYRFEFPETEIQTDNGEPLPRHEPGWQRIGRLDPTCRRSLWLRLGPQSDPLLLSTVEYFELCAGREGSDSYVKIKKGDPSFHRLLDTILTAKYASDLAEEQVDAGRAAWKSRLDEQRVEGMNAAITGAILECEYLALYEPEQRMLLEGLKKRLIAMRPRVESRGLDFDPLSVSLQKVRRETIEECAKLCEVVANREENVDRENAAEDCAYTIRKLLGDDS